MSGKIFRGKVLGCLKISFKTMCETFFDHPNIGFFFVSDHQPLLVHFHCWCIALSVRLCHPHPLLPLLLFLLHQQQAKANEAFPAALCPPVSINVERWSQFKKLARQLAPSPHFRLFLIVSPQERGQIQSGKCLRLLLSSHSLADPSQSVGVVFSLYCVRLCH